MISTLLCSVPMFISKNNLYKFRHSSLFVLLNKKCISLTLSLSLSKYIYVYCHLQTDCFIVLQHFSVARHVGCFKPGLKPAQPYVRLSIILLNHQSIYVSLGIIRHYVVAFVCLHFALCWSWKKNFWLKNIYFFIRYPTLSMHWSYCWTFGLIIRL